MKFNYLVRTPKGETQTGAIEASNQAAALKALQEHNLIVIKLRAIEQISLLTKKIKFLERVKRKELFVFFRQLAVLVEANVPLVRSLKTLAGQTENPFFSEIIFNTADDVDGGMLFSKAMSRHPKVFSAFAINLIKSGEVVGRLQESLIYLADYTEREYDLISKVRGAMLYPIFILATFIVVGILIVVMVMPNLTAILLETGQELPWSTKILIAFSDFIKNFGWLLLIAVIMIGIVAWRYLKTEQGLAQWDALKLKLPIFGKIFIKTYLARFADNLNVLIKGGVPILQGLDITGQVVGNAVFRKIIFYTRDEVKVGNTISSCLNKYKEFPPMFCQMIRTGEGTGKLDTILEKLSGFYNKEVENVVNNLSQLIEPMLIVMLGIGVSILVFAVYMPIYNLAGAF